MSEPNLYEVLGLERSASSHQIRAAFRKLVKRFHPDLFPTAAEKTRATEKLREINEAYAVLGNPKRRREYDERFLQARKPQQSARPGRSARTSARAHPKTAASQRRAPQARGRAQPWRFHWRPIRSGFQWRRISKKHIGYALGALGAIFLLGYVTRAEPRFRTAWVLVEKVEISSATGPVLPPQRNEPWSPVAEFKLVAECAVALKAIVREEELQGARAVFDERNAMAIIVQLRNRSSELSAPGSPKTNSEKAGDVPSDDASSKTESTDATMKRVRNLECRQARRVEMESPMQRALRSVGL